MKITGIAASLPSKIVTNEAVLDLIRYHSRESFQGNIEPVLKRILHYMRLSGQLTRCWLGNNENTLELLDQAFNKALKQAKLEKSDIDFLIYTGVGRGFIEPANSCMVADFLGLKNVRNFDVLDACMGWVSSLEIINDRISAGKIKAAAIVNMEFNMVDGGPIYPENFKLNSMSELPYTFPSFTIGEATTVTILTDGQPDNFKFEYTSRPDLYDLCTVPIHNWSHYCRPTDKINKRGNYRFCSYGVDLHDAALVEVPNIFKKLQLNNNEIDRVFVHGSSKKKWSDFGEAVGIRDKIFHISHETGNLVTASIPTAISMALDQEILTKGNSCLI